MLNGANSFNVVAQERRIEHESCGGVLVGIQDIILNMFYSDSCEREDEKHSVAIRDFFINFINSLR